MESTTQNDSPPSTRRLHVALIVDSSLAPGRAMTLGVAEYVRQHAPWSIYFEPRSPDESTPTWLDNWQGDGIIARVISSAMAETLAATKLPVVDVLGEAPAANFPLVHVDNAKIGALAAEHLIERGFRNFGYCGVSDRSWGRLREAAFFEAVSHINPSSRDNVHHLATDPRESNWEQSQQELSDWLKSLPQPIGVMASNDPIGHNVLDAAKRVSIRVPEQLAVVSVDNDQPLCGVSEPPLSSVDPAYDSIGFEAAALLDRMMHGESPPAGPTLLPPKSVVARKSSDVLAIEDEQVRAALRFIRENACRNISISAVVAQTPLSRSSLKRRFLAVTGNTMQGELVATRLRVAKDLLISTEMSISEIAAHIGYAHAEYFGAVFKSQLGLTPGAYRMKFKK